jgi:hypothetical protein
MSFYKFDKNDIVINSARSYPESRIYVSGTSLYFNNSGESGYKPIPHISGSILTIPRNSYTARPTSVSASTYDASNVTSSFEVDYFLGTGVLLSSNYLTATVGLSYPTNPPAYQLSALRNTLDNYATTSPQIPIAGSGWDKREQDLMLISVPSILYGSSIQEGTIDLKFYVSGTLVGRLQDTSKRGELLQTYSKDGTNDGECAGVALYDEGFLLLTGSWSLTSAAAPYVGTADDARWKYFGVQTGSVPASTFDISFNGTTRTPTMMMFAHANRGELNSSNNPTFVTKGQPRLETTSSFQYLENPTLDIQNIVSSSFQETGSFEKTVYISSIGIYDDDMNLVGTAKLANPIRKREKDTYTFKMKMDL